MLDIRKINSIKDVVDWGLCTGCGGCKYFCTKNAIELVNYENIGIRPTVKDTNCGVNCECLNICPGYQIDGFSETGKPDHIDEAAIAFGPVLEIWEGHSTHEEIRFKASSGGVLTALALYCLEQEDIGGVIHASSDSEKPWLNKTVLSTKKAELVERTGSRYAPAAPVEGLSFLNANESPCVFIGKPCDAAGVSKLCHHDPGIANKIGLILSFFCAGTPSTKATLALINAWEIETKEVKKVYYRGKGWPGSFTVEHDEQVKQMDYLTSWGKLQQHRPFRCHLCPDGTGQVADITCGDAWHNFHNNGNPGSSLILIRTERGKKIFQKAISKGYLTAQRVSITEVKRAQESLLGRRRQLWGRLLAMKLLLIPAPNFNNFFLSENFSKLTAREKFRSIIGTVKRAFRKGLIKRQKINK